MTTFRSELAERISVSINLTFEAAQSWGTVLVLLAEPAIRKWWLWQRALTRRGLAIQTGSLLLLLVLRKYSARLRSHILSQKRRAHNTSLVYLARMKKVTRTITSALPHMGFALACVLLARRFPSWTEQLTEHGVIEKIVIAVQNVTSLFVIHSLESNEGGMDVVTTSSSPASASPSTALSSTCTTTKKQRKLDQQLRSCLMRWMAFAIAIGSRRYISHSVSWIPFGTQLGAVVGATKRIALAYSIFLLWLHLPISGPRLVYTYLVPSVERLFLSASAIIDGNGDNNSSSRTANLSHRLLSVLVAGGLVSSARAQSLVEVRTNYIPCGRG